MRARDAKRLHNRDEVRIKRTGEYGYVCGDPRQVKVAGRKSPLVSIPVITGQDGYHEVWHNEVA